MRILPAVFAATLFCVLVAGCTAAPAGPTGPIASPPIAGPGHNGTANPKGTNATFVADFARVAMQGLTPAGGCVFSAVYQCQFQGGSGYSQPLKVAGTPLRLVGNATFTGGTTTTTELQVILFADVDGQRQIADENRTFISAPSPVRFDFDLSHVPKGAPLTLEVYSAAGESVVVGYAIVDMQQDFKLDGFLITKTPVTPGASPSPSPYA